ncbi:MAG: mechanosensitive ion channel [Bdellovibrio sp.]|nr:mechanosensitive ion channel [Bdellovibrio sp.]
MVQSQLPSLNNYISLPESCIRLMEFQWVYVSIWSHMDHLLSRAAVLLQSESSFTLEEWLAALTLLVLSFTLTALAQRALKKVHRDKNWRVIQELGPFIVSILYAVGLALFLEIAPVKGRFRVWADAIVYIVTILLVLRLTYRACLLGIEWSVKKNLNSPILHQGFIPLLKNLVTIVVTIMGVVMILKHFGYDVGTLLTALGVGSLAIGLAAKDTLANMISGFILIIDRNLTPGDRISLDSQTGDVQEIGLRSTQIRLTDGNTLIVPNAELSNMRILNLSKPSRSVSCTTLLRISFGSSFDSVKDACQKSFQATKGPLRDRPFQVHLTGLNEGHQLIQISFWVPDYLEAPSCVSEFNKNLLENLASKNIVPVGPLSFNFPR